MSMDLNTGDNGIPQMTNNSLIPGGFGNPTGANTGGVPKTTQSDNPFANSMNFASFFNNSNTGAGGTGIAPFPANGTNDPSLSALFPNLFPGANTGQLTSDLSHTFGGGVAGLLSSFIQGGAGFNPAIAQAFISAMQPQEARGREAIMNEFGNLGARFSTESAVGLGDFESQFNAQEMATLANLSNSATNREAQLLTALLGPAMANKAGQGGALGAITPFIPLIAKFLPGLLQKLGIGGGNSSGGGGGTLQDILGAILGTGPQTQSSPIPGQIPLDPFGGGFSGAGGDIFNPITDPTFGGANIGGDLPLIFG